MAKINITPGINIRYDMEDAISYGGATRSFITGTRIDISEEALAELQDDSALLYAIIDSGIDEWEKYDEAIALWKERRGA